MQSGERGRWASARIAFEDLDFLQRDDLRPVRLQLELLKPQMLMDEENIVSTIVVFGSSRTAAPGQSDEQASWYEKYREEARRFARLVSSCCQDDRCECVITTGGGPGIMEAANRGAAEIGAKTIGLTIDLPEEIPNRFVTPKLCFRFHYFALRKMHFLLRAAALVIFPGGFGTLDELFDALTLIQTGKMAPIPIVLFGREYWSRVISFEAMVEMGTLDAEDLDLITWADSAEGAWQAIRAFYGNQWKAAADDA